LPLGVRCEGHDAGLSKLREWDSIIKERPFWLGIKRLVVPFTTQ